MPNKMVQYNYVAIATTVITPTRFYHFKCLAIKSKKIFLLISRYKGLIIIKA